MEPIMDLEPTKGIAHLDVGAHDNVGIELRYFPLQICDGAADPLHGEAAVAFLRLALPADLPDEIK